MIIELKWLDGNKSSNHMTQIYRAEMPFDDESEATLIATVESGVDTYADMNLKQGVMYYYRFRNIRGNSMSEFSKLFVFEAEQFNGPGPSKLVFGDEHFGYYGKFPVNPDICPTINDLRTLFGLPEIDLTGNEPTFHKFAVGGSIRGAYTTPVALGSEIPEANDALKTILTGGNLVINKGLHSWALIVPSTEYHIDPDHPIEHHPGELRAMLGAITEMYAQVEEVRTGNRTGNRISEAAGRISFYNQLKLRFPTETVRWIISSDWDLDAALAVAWTGATDYPVAKGPSEFYVERVEYADKTRWDHTVVWPVIIYLGLSGPK